MPPDPTLKRRSYGARVIDLVVIDAGDLVDGIGDQRDLRQTLGREHVTRLRLEHDGDRVRTTELGRVAIVGLDERMILRE